MSRSVLAAPFLLATLLLAGCSGGDGSEGAAAHDESDIIDHIGAVEDADGRLSVELDDGTECDHLQILNTASAVRTFADAGDPVATNPDETVGVVVGGSSAGTCLDGVSALLKDFD